MKLYVLFIHLNMQTTFMNCRNEPGERYQHKRVHFATDGLKKNRCTEVQACVKEERFPFHNLSPNQ